MMLKYLFKISVQNIRKFYFSSILHIVGFTIAITSATLIGMYVYNEYSYDQFQKNKDSIYRLEINNITIHPALIGDLLESKCAQIKRHCTFSFWGNDNIVTIEKNGILQSSKFKVSYADSSFSDIFTIKTIEGDVKSALSNPLKVVIPESCALKLFGTTRVIDKPIKITFGIFNNIANLTIGAVIEDIPNNSSIPNSIYITMKNKGSQNDWSDWSFSTFFEIPNINNIEDVEKDIIRLADENWGSTSSAVKIHLRKLTDIHFSQNVEYEFAPIANKSTINILLLVGLLILIVGIINFINFTTALFPERIKNLNIQKLFGCNNRLLRFEIIIESVVLSLTAAIFSAIIIQWLIKQPFVHNFMSIPSSVFSIRLLLLMFPGSILIGILAGWYPSLVLTSLKVSDAIKTKYIYRTKKINVRGILITFQFFVSILLIISTLTILKQRAFLFNYDTGFTTKNILYFKLPAKENKGLINEIIKSAYITDYTFAGHGPQNELMNWGREIDGKHIQYNVWPVRENFLRFFGIKVIKGRDFSNNIEADRNNFIFNKAAVDKYGSLISIGKEMPGFDWKGRIIGITENFNYASLHNTIMPLCFWLTDERAGIMFVKFKGSPGNVTEHIKNCFTQFSPESLFDYRFIDETLHAYYEKEENLAYLIITFGIIAIIIACIGIVGLSVFVSKQKTKEIGIRKANGSNNVEILKLLNKSLLIWIALAFILACPVSWFIMNKWLQNFAYRTEISWWIYLIAGLFAALMTVLAASWQSIKAAKTNPIESLRYE